MSSFPPSLFPPSAHPDGCRCDRCSYLAPSIGLESAPATNLKAMLRGSRSRGGFSGLRPIKIKLWSNLVTNLSAAATPLAQLSVIGLSTGTFPELSSFLPIYDEARLITVHLHHMLFASTAATGAPFQSTGAMNIQFDPSASAPTSLAQALEESYNSGPLFVTPGVNGTAQQSSFFNQPYRKMHASVPKLAPITGSDCPGSAWFTLDSATATTMCCIGQYTLALGTLGITAAQFLIELDLELRLRT